MKRKLSIEGMKCSHCVGNLRDVLTEDIAGVEVYKFLMSVNFTRRGCLIIISVRFTRDFQGKDVIV